MHWNHRVVRRVYPDGTELLGIYEVYYDGDGVPRLVTTHPIAPLAFDDGAEPDRSALKGQLRWTLEAMLAALEQPVLDYDRDFQDPTGDPNVGNAAIAATDDSPNP